MNRSYHNRITRTISLCTCALLLIGITVAVLSGCGKQAENDSESEKLKIVATVFPEYDWVKEVLGEKKDDVELTLLLDNGVDLHSFQPTAEDLITISDCDLFLYIGGESDNWVEDALKTVGNANRRVINCMDVLADRVVEEETVEGMETQEETDEEEAPEKDEHIWLSLRNAKIIAKEIAANLSLLDPSGNAVYESNATSYGEKLSALDKKYTEAVENGVRDTLLFADRFSFRYLTEDYHLSYYAAFSGCSAESEASFETVLFLSEKTDALSLPYIMVIEGSDEKIAETVIANTTGKNQKILKLNSMQSVTAKDVESGTTYLGVMENNLTVLSEALGN